MPNPHWNWFFLWLRKAQRARDRGRGSSFFSSVAPTTQLLSKEPTDSERFCKSRFITYFVTMNFFLISFEDLGMDLSLNIRQQSLEWLVNDDTNAAQRMIWLSDMALWNITTKAIIEFIINFTKWWNLDECMHACVPTFKEQVGFGDVQLVPKWCTSLLHTGARFKLHTNLQLIQKTTKQRSL